MYYHVLIWTINNWYLSEEQMEMEQKTWHLSDEKYTSVIEPENCDKRKNTANLFI